MENEGDGLKNLSQKSLAFVDAVMQKGTLLPALVGWLFAAAQRPLPINQPEKENVREC